MWYHTHDADTNAQPYWYNPLVGLDNRENRYFPLLEISSKEKNTITTRMCQEQDYPTVRRFGQKLRALRTSRGMTMRHLSHAIGISSAHVSDIENGKTKPGVDVVIRVAQFFNVSTDVLLNDELELG